jgi:hypothetical protein
MVLPELDALGEVGRWVVRQIRTDRGGSISGYDTHVAKVICWSGTGQLPKMWYSDGSSTQG